MLAANGKSCEISRPLSQPDGGSFCPAMALDRPRGVAEAELGRVTADRYRSGDHTGSLPSGHGRPARRSSRISLPARPGRRSAYHRVITVTPSHHITSHHTIASHRLTRVTTASGCDTSPLCITDEAQMDTSLPGDQ